VFVSCCLAVDLSDGTLFGSSTAEELVTPLLRRSDREEVEAVEPHLTSPGGGEGLVCFVMPRGNNDIPVKRPLCSAFSASAFYFGGVAGSAGQLEPTVATPFLTVATSFPRRVILGPSSFPPTSS
jgi:hypothetical protein